MMNINLFYLASFDNNSSLCYEVCKEPNILWEIAHSGHFLVHIIEIIGQLGKVIVIHIPMFASHLYITVENRIEHNYY